MTIGLGKQSHTLPMKLQMPRYGHHIGHVGMRNPIRKTAQPAFKKYDPKTASHPN